MKKTFSKFLATAAAVSMIASASTVVNADDVTTEGTPVEGTSEATTDVTVDDTTEAATSEATEAATGEVAEDPTEAATGEVTEDPTEAATGEATEDPTEAATGEATEEATDATDATEEAAYSFKTTACEHGDLIIEGVVNGDSVEAIVIPEKIGDAKVVGIADFAFADLDKVVTIDTQTATNLSPDHVSTLSFVTKASLKDYFVTLFGEDATEEEVLTAVANEIYGEKAEGETWSAEELADVKAKIAKKAALAGATLPEDLKDVDALVEAAAVMLQNEDKLMLTAATTEALTVWEAEITNDEVEVLYTDDSAIKDIIVSLPVSALLGDANNDGKVNVRDAAAIASALAKAEGDKLPAHADYNEDGSVNVRDAAAIASALAKGEIPQN